MSYTYRSLTFVWLITFALFALTGSGALAGPWLLLLVLIAVTAPAFILRRPRQAITPASPDRPRAVLDRRDRQPLDDVYRWENEGGGPQVAVGSAFRPPVHAGR